MSYADATSRIAQIQSTLAVLNPAARLALQPTAGSGVFAGQLDSALAAPASVTIAPPVPTAGALAGPPTPYDELFVEYGQQYGVPPALLKAVASAESDFNPNAVSPAGAQGLMQLMPVNQQDGGVTDPFDPRQSIMGGAKELSGYMRQFNGDLEKVLAAYNAGPNAVLKYGGIPPYAETQAYVPKVLRLYGEYSATPNAAVGASAIAVPTASSAGSTMVAAALRFLGTDYSWGGGGTNGPSYGIEHGSRIYGFDCSGLTQYAAAQVGIRLDRTTYDQIRQGANVPREQIAPGDLVFFGSANDPHHVGIYLGNDQFVEAPQTGDVVKVSRLSNRSDLIAIRRVA